MTQLMVRTHLEGLQWMLGLEASRKIGVPSGSELWQWTSITHFIDDVLIKRPQISTGSFPLPCFTTEGYVFYCQVKHFQHMQTKRAHEKLLRWSPNEFAKKKKTPKQKDSGRVTSPPQPMRGAKSDLTRSNWGMEIPSQHLASPKMQKNG